MKILQNVEKLLLPLSPFLKCLQRKIYGKLIKYVRHLQNHQGLPREDESNPTEFKQENIPHDAWILCKFI